MLTPQIRDHPFQTGQTTGRQTSLAHQLEVLDQRSKENVRNAKANNTQRSYRSHWNTFTAFCLTHGLQHSPATPTDIARFLTSLELEGKSAATIRAARSAVAHAHRLMGYPNGDNPARHPYVSENLSGISRRSPPQRQAQALLQEALDAIRATAMLPRPSSNAGKPENAERARSRGRMDIALCLTLRDAGLRRSEAAALTWEDIETWPDGSGRITINRSKTNQDGPPETVAITRAAMAALDAVRPQSWSPAQPVFQLSASQISRRVEAAARAAGLGPGFSGHSGRVGLARNMSANGAPVNATMKQGRWNRAETVARYTRKEEAGAALHWIG